MQRRASRGGGFLLVLGIFLGVIVGIWRGEPSLGFLVGTAVGGAAALLVWLLDRRAG